MADDLGGFGSLSVSGHKEAQAQKERDSLKEKILKRQQESRMQEQMTPPKPVQMPASVLKRTNDALAKAEIAADRLKIMHIGSQIDRYYQYFGDGLLANRKKKAFNTLTTLAEAQQEMDSVELELASSNCYQNTENLFLMGVGLLETAGPKVGLRLENFSKIFEVEEGEKENLNLNLVKPELMEISIKYDYLFARGAIARMAQKIGFMIKKVHDSNVQMELEGLSKSPSEAMQQKHADL